MTSDKDDFSEPDGVSDDELGDFFTSDQADSTSDDTTPESDRRDATDAATDGSGEDDPWANVATEDELKRRATQDLDATTDDTQDEDASDDATGVGDESSDEGADSPGDGPDDIDTPESPEPEDEQMGGTDEEEETDELSGSSEDGSNTPHGEEGGSEDSSQGGDDADADEPPFSDRLAHEMKAWNVTPTDLVDETKFSRDVINEILSDERSPSKMQKVDLLATIHNIGDVPQDEPEGESSDGSNGESDTAEGTTEDTHGHNDGEEPDAEVAADDAADSAQTATGSDTEQTPEPDSEDASGETMDDITEGEHTDTVNGGEPPEPPEGAGALGDADLDIADLDAELIPDDVSCENCVHRNVCVILSSFSPRLADENWDAGAEDEGSPVDPMDFAKICDSYHPEGNGEPAADAPEQ